MDLLNLEKLAKQMSSNVELPEINFELPEYEDTDLKKAVDDLESRIDRKIADSSRRQHAVNVALITIGLLTLVATVIGLFL